LAATEGADLSEAGARLRGALAAWDYDCPSGLEGTDPEAAEPVADPAVATASAGCAAFHVLVPYLWQGAFRDDMEVAAIGPEGEEERLPYLRSLFNLLLRPDDLARGGAFWWDDVRTEDTEETLGDVVVAATNAAGDELEARLGADVDGWRWGRLHTVTLRAPLFSDAGVVMFNHGPFVNDGGLYTVDVASPSRLRTVASDSGLSADAFAHRSGPSMRLACEAGADDPVRCTIQLPGGQRHFRDSPHFDDLLLRWLANDPVPLIADVSEIEPERVYPAP